MIHLENIKTSKTDEEADEKKEDTKTIFKEKKDDSEVEESKVTKTKFKLEKVDTRAQQPAKADSDDNDEF